MADQVSNEARDGEQSIDSMSRRSQVKQIRRQRTQSAHTDGFVSRSESSSPVASTSDSDTNEMPLTPKEQLYEAIVNGDRHLQSYKKAVEAAQTALMMEMEHIENLEKNMRAYLKLAESNSNDREILNASEMMRLKSVLQCLQPETLTAYDGTTRRAYYDKKRAFKDIVPHQLYVQQITEKLMDASKECIVQRANDTRANNRR